MWLKRKRRAEARLPVSSALPVRRLKVLHLLATMPVGGAEDLVAAIVRGLDPKRFAVSVATLGPPGPVAQELGARGYKVVSLGLDIKRTSTWRIVGAVRRLLKADRPDILHTHLYHPNLYGRLGALGLGLSGVVAAVHNSYNRSNFTGGCAIFSWDGPLTGFWWEAPRCGRTCAVTTGCPPPGFCLCPTASPWPTWTRG